MRVGRQEKSERSWGWAVGEVHTSQRCLSPWLGGRCQRRQLLLQLPSVRSLWPTDLLSIGTGTSGAARWSTTTVLKEGQHKLGLRTMRCMRAPVLVLALVMCAAGNQCPMCQVPWDGLHSRDCTEVRGSRA
jgi:hypothetical protein